MEYHNPQLPEGINTSQEHPLKEFSLLLVATIVLVLTLSAVLGFGAGWLATKIPFSAEKKVADLYDIRQHTDSAQHPQLTNYLQSLADKISQAQQLPQDMPITVHYMDTDTVNAFATLGGNLFVFRGLLEKLSNENELVTLLGHEIAHVKYRHPIQSLGRGVIVGIAMTAITGSTDSTVLGDAGLLSVLKFSRDMEQQADEEAMVTLNKLYGHINGGAQLFELFHHLRLKNGNKEGHELFSTHPLDAKRITHFSEVAQQKGWQQTGELTSLPVFYQKAFQ